MCKVAIKKNMNKRSVRKKLISHIRQRQQKATTRVDHSEEDSATMIQNRRSLLDCSLQYCFCCAIYDYIYLGYLFDDIKYLSGGTKQNRFSEERQSFFRVTVIKVMDKGAHKKFWCGSQMSTKKCRLVLIFFFSKVTNLMVECKDLSHICPQSLQPLQDVKLKSQVCTAFILVMNHNTLHK